MLTDSICFSPSVFARRVFRLFRLFPGSFRQQTGNSALRFRRFVKYGQLRPDELWIRSDSLRRLPILEHVN